ncbi:methyl-accepting chemotaxis protein [Paenibacillus glucanolyticus]|jgi:methyl-accepting chemotaxis protein|uniref:methyl-accepting chemotaxis protein n=1 Tax=Paenibacillus TaxID=44249 RepID=UPI0003E233C7|nr:MULTISPECIES: methyl-accepting chemotaxis protein [Paenibacillus]ANA78631.1 chemotaxis protein [Paenibacillus glucanolyticus]AVV57454.1 methyl-accepting chemotaxis protein [Paenibacillus glucanolyticus]ETT34888.1 methyl-accepting chemotaxis sensory transducer [Paenibacillus sp. FSL R5-808]MPY16944.1 methyl-accepting chemotaxis protein [Paenibacillus glucanolyticus]
MFDWLGYRQGLPLWISWRLNRKLKEDVEEIFEGIAETRKELLFSWSHEYWGHLDRLKEQLDKLHASGDCSAHSLSSDSRMNQEQLFSALYSRASDFTELFVLNPSGEVTYSTYASHIGTTYDDGSQLGRAIHHLTGLGTGKLLFGPYGDPITLTIGPRTSTFHDKMTLLFMNALHTDGAFAGILCGRVPNDVIGDLIQRESGHIYPDSGDNYIFMAKPELNLHIAPGTALSRSRFEDRTFTHGENLKDGVTTDWGTVSVKEHTELELMFTDPATGQLHPGVASTIRNGDNLFVAFPGYSDYRHIPVIGKGVTFRLPHCPDDWGMMCEGDLEEVYRIRSIRWRHSRLHSASTLLSSVLTAAIVYAAASHLSPLAAAIIGLAACLITGLLTSALVGRKEIERVADRLRRLSRFIRINAEGTGDLTQRLDTRHFDHDETRELAKWINNMIDSLESIMMQVKLTAGDVSSSQQIMNDTTAVTVTSAQRVSSNISEMIRSMRSQLLDIDAVKERAEHMRETLRQLEQQANEQIDVAKNEVVRIGDKMSHISSKVEETNHTIRIFMQTVREIRGVLHAIEQISSQTHLLALNASIEAARVGEHGQGFAVVASEIRKLSDLTRQSTEEVHGIISHIYKDAEFAFQSMEEGTKVVQEGNLLVSAASELLTAAAEDDLRKHQAVDEVVQLMEKIASVSKENRKISKDVESRVQELSREIESVRHTSGNVEVIANSMQQLVGQFKLTDSRIR